MLYPLDKGFCSTRFYQSGGCHEEAVARRVWSIDKTGSTDRALELHRLLTEQKPFAAHKAVIARRAEEGKQRDAENRREHVQNIKALNATIADRAAEERQGLQRRIREHREMRCSSDAALASGMQAQQQDYKNWRTEMETKVKGMEPLCGTHTAIEDAARTTARAESRKNMVQSSKAYNDKMASLKDSINQRSPSVPILRGPRQETVIEQKKASGLLALSKQHRDYEAHLEDLYDRHDERKRNNLNDTRRAINEANDNRTQFLAASLKARSGTIAAATQEIADLKDRVNKSHKPFGGYAPVHKSDKRHREEAAHREIAAASGGGLSGSRNMTNPGGERTLSPRTLGLTPGSG